MNLEFLIGYRIGVCWQGEDKSEEYVFVEDGHQCVKNQINIKSNFAKQLVNSVKDGFTNIENFSDFVIEYIKPPQFTTEVVYNRQIEKLYHFTSIKNLKSVLSQGIMSIDRLTKENVEYFINDKDRLDNRPQFISCSIGYPNGILLNYFKNKYQTRYAIIEISSDILYENFAMISTCNASTKMGKYIKPIKYIDELYEGERFNLPGYLPTDEQAEVLIKDKIPPQFFTRIFFEHEFDMKYYQTSTQKIVQPKMFDYRNNYLNNKIQFKIKKY